MRKLARSPGPAAALLCSIALGIGSNAAVYGVIRGLVLGPSQEFDRTGVVSIFDHDDHGPVARAGYLALRARTDAFEWVGSAHVTERTVQLAGRPVVVTVAAISPEIGRMLGLPLERGVVLSEELAGNKTVRVGRTELAVAGVAPPSIRGLYADRPVSVWMSLGEEAPAKTWVFARLRAGVRPEQVTDPCCQVAAYSGTPPGVLGGLERVSLLLQAAAGLVLLIGYANVASLQLGSTVRRLRETSVRIALGVSRGQLASAVLAESLVIALAGGALGGLFALWTLRILPALLFREDAEAMVQAPDGWSFLLWAGSAFTIILVFGLAPVVTASQARPGVVLRGEASGGSAGSGRLGSALVIAQMAGCCLLVVAAGYLHQSFRAALRSSVSRALREPLLATVQPQPDVGPPYYRRIEEAAAQVSGIAVRGWAARLPGYQPVWQSFRIEPRGMAMREVRLNVDSFTARSLDLFRLPPVAGRLFGMRDHHCRAAIVNEEAGGRLFREVSVGRVVLDAAGMPAVIVGVVAAKRPAAATIYYYDAASARYDAPSAAPTRSAMPATFRTPLEDTLVVADLNTNIVSPEFLAGAGFSLMKGRLFPDQPGSGRCRVGVVDREAEALYFGGQAIGAAVIDEAGRRTDIIGVVQSAELGTMQRGREPTLYFPMEQDDARRMTLLVESGAGDAETRLKSALDAVPGGYSRPVVQSLEHYLTQTGLAPLRVSTVVLNASTVLALLLSVLGLQGTLHQRAIRQRRELAIRIALGAAPRHVIAWVLGQGVRLAAAGLATGLAVSLLVPTLLARVMATRSAPALWVWLAAPLALLVVVAVASVLPARRSLLADPLRALRQD